MHIHNLFSQRKYAFSAAKIIRNCVFCVGVGSTLKNPVDEEIQESLANAKVSARQQCVCEGP